MKDINQKEVKFATKYIKLNVEDVLDMLCDNFELDEHVSFIDELICFYELDGQTEIIEKLLMINDLKRCEWAEEDEEFFEDPEEFFYLKGLNNG